MKDAGSQLDPLLHRLAECPSEFLQVAEGAGPDGVDVAAIVYDTLRALAPDQNPESQRATVAGFGYRTQPHLTLISIVCWLLNDDWFLANRPPAAPLSKLLTSDGLAPLAGLIRPARFVSDPDRREELVRTCLAQLGLRPAGETASQATDRLSSLDSAERDRVLRATAAAERRAREIREAMARQQALESASRYGE